MNREDEGSEGLTKSEGREGNGGRGEATKENTSVASWLVVMNTFVHKKTCHFTI